MSSLWVLCMLHLKYQFTQLNFQINHVISMQNFSRLIHLFKLHQSIEKEARSLNEEIKYYIYILYKFVKPCFNVFVYLSFEPDTTSIARLFVVMEITMISILIFSMNYLCASVTTAAHKSQTTLYNAVLNKEQNIGIRIRVKILRFIERLSGPEIGFYCFDLFPMTSYYFNDYVFDSIVSYLLVLKMLKKNDFIK